MTPHERHITVQTSCQTEASGQMRHSQRKKDGLPRVSAVQLKCITFLDYGQTKQHWISNVMPPSLKVFDCWVRSSFITCACIPAFVHFNRSKNLQPPSAGWCQHSQTGSKVWVTYWGPHGLSQFITSNSTACSHRAEVSSHDAAGNHSVCKHKNVWHSTNHNGAFSEGSFCPAAAWWPWCYRCCRTPRICSSTVNGAAERHPFISC